MIRDKVCLYRHINYPELVFKRNLEGFEANQGQKWKLGEESDCYLCLKCKYTMVFFNDADLGDEGRNSELTEITDPDFIKQC